MVSLRKKISLVAGMFLLFALIGNAQEEVRMLSPETVDDIEKNRTAIIIRSNVPKALVFLNDDFQGLTPLTIYDLVPAQYQLTVQKESCGKSMYIIEIKRALAENYYIELNCNQNIPETENQKKNLFFGYQFKN